MNKQEFLEELREELMGLPQDEIEERLDFYSEMIEDRMEEGLSEEVAVAEIGIPAEIAAQIIEDIPLTRFVVEKVKPKRKLKVWEIVLLVLGSPIWVPLLLAAIIIALIAALWAVEAALAVSAVALAVVGFYSLFHANVPGGILAFGAGAACAGVAIFLFFGCREATRGILILTKKIIYSIKTRLMGKENS